MGSTVQTGGRNDTARTSPGHAGGQGLVIENLDAPWEQGAALFTVCILALPAAGTTFDSAGQLGA
ncbi:hypothetical protein [Streptomyces albidus (ex Kaewkla and Franco 2022)]|uniref:hypothetical protein n=1 Tax=Streptomyces albidus (ex Kaewkla and Franco 2022) TaxID=722709 RepID=UPI0015EE40F5|nr:hypothetical protein [Streptomyces albidus (ex Kaewkla and Franco 2022)]